MRPHALLQIEPVILRQIASPSEEPQREVTTCGIHSGVAQGEHDVRSPDDDQIQRNNRTQHVLRRTLPGLRSVLDLFTVIIIDTDRREEIHTPQPRSGTSPDKLLPTLWQRPLPVLHSHGIKDGCTGMRALVRRAAPSTHHPASGRLAARFKANKPRTDGHGIPIAGPTTPRAGTPRPPPQAASRSERGAR